MDLGNHILWAIFLFGRKNLKWLLAGVILPDFLYILAFIFKIELLHIFGQYLHSIFIAGTLLIIGSTIYFHNRKNTNFLFFCYGYASNIAIDLLSHTCDGSMYLLPFKNNIIKIGFFCWRDQILSSYVVIAALFLTLIVIYKWKFQENILVFLTARKRK